MMPFENACKFMAAQKYKKGTPAFATKAVQ